MGNLTLRSVKGSPLTNAEMDGNFEYFTGSHAITGSLIVTGGITGSLQGITSASYASTASFVANAQTASYVVTAQTASYVLNAVSASRATTASYALVAQTLLGSIQSASYATSASNAATASYVAGGNVDGTVALAANAISSNEVYTAKSNTNSDYKILFTDNLSLDDSSNVYKDTNSIFLYNPGLGKLTVGAISASAGITGSLLGAASAVTPLSQSVIITGSLTQLNGIVSLGVADAGSGNRNINTFTSGLNEYVVIGAGNGVSPLKLNTLQLNGASGTVSVAAANSISLLSSNTIISGSVLVSGSIIPNTNGVSSTSSFNLGSPTAAWKDIYVSNGTINFLNSAGVVQSTIGVGNNQLTGYTTISGSAYISASLIQGSNNRVGQFFSQSVVEDSYRAHAQGESTWAANQFAHSEGQKTTASGNHSHAEGNSTYTSEPYAHSEGFATWAGGNSSHAEGYQTKTTGTVSHAEGRYTLSAGNGSHSEGYYATASGDNSHAEGESTWASGSVSHAEGLSSQAIGSYSHAEGEATYAIGYVSHAEGYGSIASGSYSHAEGSATQANGFGSHAEGYGTQAIGLHSHAEGGWGAGYEGGTATGPASHAEGLYTTAANTGSHAEGNGTQANGVGSHSEGYNTIALGNFSHAEGFNTIAAGNYQHVSGKYNVSSSNTDDLFIIGNGIQSARRDAFKVKMSGSIVLPTTQSAAPTWTGTDGEMIFATVTGSHRFYVWMAGAWRSGSLNG